MVATARRVAKKARIEAASADELDQFLDRLLVADTVEAVLAEPS